MRPGSLETRQAFNVKPDLVVQTPTGHVLCVEAKWGSGEGYYPSSFAELSEFKKRKLSTVRQTAVQAYLVEDLLGFNAAFRYLVRSDKVKVGTHEVITWQQVFGALDFPAANWIRPRLG